MRRNAGSGIYGRYGKYGDSRDQADMKSANPLAVHRQCQSSASPWQVVGVGSACRAYLGDSRGMEKTTANSLCYSTVQSLLYLLRRHTAYSMVNHSIFIVRHLRSIGDTRCEMRDVRFKKWDKDN